MATPRPRPTLQRPIRSLPRTTVPKASYAFASAASQLQSRGLSPRRVDSLHPVPVIRGASYSRRGSISVKAIIGLGALSVLLASVLLAVIGMGWSDTTIVVGTNSVSNVGSLINGVGFTNGAMAIAGTTNQLLFGGTNTAPANTNVSYWVSVQVPGMTNAFRLGLSY